MELNMTEAEALKILNGESENSNNISDVQIALKIAAKALEEVLAFKSIGTAEHFRRLSEKSKNGLLAELPCKPGDHVWVLFHNYCAECEVTKLTLTKYPNVGLDMWVIDEERPIQSSSSEFGFTLFHTEEEAKCVLEKEEEEKLR